MNLRFLNVLQPVGLLVLRVALGAIMVAHGYQKVLGGGLHHHAAFVGSLGLPSWLGYVSSFTELFGGILLVIGLITRIAAIGICINLTVAILKVHLHQGIMGHGQGQPGYQLPLAIAAGAFALFTTGAGQISLDWLLGPKK